MKKMTLDDLKNLFPAYDPTGRREITRATKKGFKHQHKPTWLPPKSKLTPAEWKRRRRKLASA